jgi:hypothetical protein
MADSQEKLVVCDCRKNPAEFTVAKESGEEVIVCRSCAEWWKKHDPTVTLWTLD